jgi:seryl-tRNA synthetase
MNAEELIGRLHEALDSKFSSQEEARLIEFEAAIHEVCAERDQLLKDRDAAFEMGQRYGEAGQKSIDPLVAECDRLAANFASAQGHLKAAQDENSALKSQMREQRSAEKP